jgi:hypothetical protein
MDALAKTVHKVLSGYTNQPERGYRLLTVNSNQTVFAVVSLVIEDVERNTNLDLLVRILIIEKDIPKRRLLYEFIEAGIPYSMIALPFEGIVNVAE